MKKKIKVLLISFGLLLCLSLFGYFIFSDKLTSFFSKKEFDEDNVGKIYFSDIDSEHVAKASDDFTMFADNELLVVAKDGTSYKKIEKLAEKYNAEIVGYIEQTGDYQWKLDDTYDLEGLEKLADELADGKVVYRADVNYITELNDTAADGRTEESPDRAGFYYGSEWKDDIVSRINMSITSEKSWAFEAIRTPYAWDLLDENKDKLKPVKVGLIDRFTRYKNFYDHTDLEFAFMAGNNITEASDDPTISHGIHVAGITAARADNKEGICGVYPYGVDSDGNSNLYGYSLGSIDYDNAQSIVSQKIAYAELIVRNVKVINESKGFNNLADKWYDNDESLRNYENGVDTIGDFLNRLLKKGYDFVIVNAAGNDSFPVNYDAKYSLYANYISITDYPELYKRIIVVGSVNANMNRALDSNCKGDRVDIYAPGGGATPIKENRIYSTVITSYNYESTDSSTPISANYGYGYMRGTSQAAPHVSGVAAMVWSCNNSLTGAQVKEIICDRDNFLDLTSDYLDSDDDALADRDYDALNVIDAEKCVRSALESSKGTTSKNQTTGIATGYVYEDDENGNQNDETLVPIPNAMINVYQPGGNLGILNTESEQVKTHFNCDDYGHYEIVLEDGEYNIEIWADGYAKNELEDVTVKSNEVTYCNNIFLEKLKLTATVADYDVFLKTGVTETLENAQIVVKYHDSGETVVINNGGTETSVFRSDDNGDFGIPLDEGKYDIEISADGYETKIIEAIDLLYQDNENYDIGTITLKKDSWREAYAEFLRNGDYIDKGKYFSLCYVNDDDIPELVIHGRQGLAEHAATDVYVYSYYNREIVRNSSDEYEMDYTAANEGSNNFTYVERGNKFIAGWFNNGVGWCTVYNIQNGEFVVECTWFSDLSDPNNFSYAINGSEVTMREYEGNQLLYNNAYKWTKDTGDYEITEENIKRYILGEVDLESILAEHIEARKADIPEMGDVTNFITNSDGTVAYASYGWTGSICGDTFCIVTNDGVTDVVSHTGFNRVYDIQFFTDGGSEYVVLYIELNSNGGSTPAISVYRVDDSDVAFTSIDTILLELEYYDSSMTYDKFPGQEKRYHQNPFDKIDDLIDFSEGGIIINGKSYSYR